MPASVKNCCIPQCGKRRADDVVLHSFPNPEKEKERFISWVDAVGTLSTLDKDYIFKNRKICHDHFETKYQTWSKKLSNIAVPTLHIPAYLHAPEHNGASDASTIRELPGSKATTLDTTHNLIKASSNSGSYHYYISNFDPSLHDIDAWCEEVERAREINSWDDKECLSRIANRLKGDARGWLDDWTSDDRTWPNFKTKFKLLCSRRNEETCDAANILYDVMSIDSDNYPTYEEYARRCILRLNVVRGLSDELTAAIIIRGITDARVRGAAADARLLTKDIVQFLSLYTKPKSNTPRVSTVTSQ